jgi:nucleoside-diphosphate-sugar epimerase
VSVIAVIGANGQVGTEVCLYLNQMNDVQVKPISRTELGSSFLRRCGLECYHGSVESESDAKRLLADCDLVADFSLIKGKAFQIRKTITTMVSNGIRFSPQKAQYVYISTVMAFGMSSKDVTFRKHLFSASVYGATKRYGEKLARKVGEKTGKSVYALRLGQVHGELQEDSRSIRNGLKDELTYVPTDLSWTVFAFTIAEALANIAKGKERPGLYTMVSVPQWSWKDVHEFYCAQKGVVPNVVYEPPTNESQKDSKKSKMYNFLFKKTKDVLTPYREIIAGYILHAMPKIELKVSALYLLANAKAQISKMECFEKYRPYGDTFKGPVPGQRLKSLTDSRIAMAEPLKKVRSVIDNLTK